MNRRLGRQRLAAAGVIVLVCAIAGVARAASVVLVRPPRPTPVTNEATVRLSGELAAAGFDVRVVDQPRGSDVRASLEEAAAGPDVEAVVAILGAEDDDARDAAELWVIDRVTGKTVVRRVTVQPGARRPAETLSIRALELLRASFLEVALAARRAAAAESAQAPSAAVERFAQRPLEEAIEDRTRETSRWGVEVGGCLLGSVGGSATMPPALLPVARLQRRLGDLAFARLGVAGLGTRAHLDFPGGSADVSQQLGLLEGGVRFRAQARVQPFLSLGVGALHAAATGQSTGVYMGSSGDRWAAVFDAGAGVRVGLRGRFELVLEAHAEAAHPYPTVRFIDTTVATEGRLSRPILVGGASVVVWL